MTSPNTIIADLSAELEEVKQKFAEQRHKYDESVGGFKRDLQEKLDQQRTKNARLIKQLADRDALIAELQKAVNLIYSWARNWDSEFMNDPEWKDRDFPSIQLAMKHSDKELGKK